MGDKNGKKAKKRKQPLVSIDVVPVRVVDGQLQVALAPRLYEPFLDVLALPGVLLGAHETIEAAAYRAIAVKADIDAWLRVRNLQQIGAFDTADRDPRGRTISISLIAVVEPGYDGRAAWAAWDADVMEGALPFDHEEIVAKALDELRVRLWTDRELTRALLGDTFSTREAAALSEQLGATVDRTNLTRMLKSYPGLSAEGSVQSGKGRPATAWRFA